MHSEIGVMVSNMRTRERSTNNTVTINKILVLLGSMTDKLHTDQLQIFHIFLQCTCLCVVRSFLRASQTCRKSKKSIYLFIQLI